MLDNIEMALCLIGTVSNMKNYMQKEVKNRLHGNTILVSIENKHPLK